MINIGDGFLFDSGARKLVIVDGELLSMCGFTATVKPTWLIKYWCNVSSSWRDRIANPNYFKVRL